MEAEHDSHEGADVETESLAEIVGLLRVLGHALGHQLGEVGHFAHNEEEIFLNVLGDLVRGAGVEAVLDAELRDVADCVYVAGLDALRDNHEVADEGHHLGHVELVLHDHPEQLNDFGLGLLAQAGVLHFVDLVKALLETLVETATALEHSVEFFLFFGLPDAGSAGDGGNQEDRHNGSSESFHLYLLVLNTLIII